MVSKYEVFNDELSQVNKSLFLSRNQPPFQSSMRIPHSSTQNVSEKPFSFMDPIPSDSKEVYDPKNKMHCFINEKNKGNLIYITRRTFGFFFVEQFHEGLTFFRLSKNEFDAEMKKIKEKISDFSWMKTGICCYFTFLIIAFILILIGVCINTPKFVYNNRDERVDEINRMNAVNFLICTGVILIIMNSFIYLIVTIFKLKNIEFEIGKFLNEINKTTYLNKNIYWKIGGFCRCLEIELLPLTPQQFWLMQTQFGNAEIFKK